METGNTVIVWLLALAGVLCLVPGIIELIPGFFDFYKTAIELYLFCFSAFLVLKRVFFYRLKENGEVVRLKQQSKKQNVLFAQGIVLGLLYVAYLCSFGDLYSFNLVMIALLLLYYFGQILTNNNPSIYVDSRAFSYDNYFVEEWKWKDLQSIVIDKEKLLLVGEKSDFELDFELIDGLDYVRLSQEVEASILDGTFAEENNSRLLLDLVESYAQLHGVRLKMPG